MNCIFCSRPLKHATVMLAGNPVGPDCARRHLLIGTGAAHNKRVERMPRPPKPVPKRDPDTLEMFPDHDGAIPQPDGSRSGTMETSESGVATAN